MSGNSLLYSLVIICGPGSTIWFEPTFGAVGGLAELGAVGGLAELGAVGGLAALGAVGGLAELGAVGGLAKLGAALPCLAGLPLPLLTFF